MSNGVPLGEYNATIPEIIPKKKKNKRGYLQGLFIPKNPKKYEGDLSKLSYKSKYELSVMKIFDANPNIIKWSYEPFSIPYFSEWDNKQRNYWIDFIIQKRSSNGEIETLAIEVKPYCQTIPPKKGRRKKQETYLRECEDWQVNSDKWKAAEIWAKKNGIRFVKVTENE